MMSFKTIRGRERLIGHGIPQPVPITLDAVIYDGAVVYGEDGRYYASDGLNWVDIGQGPQGIQGTQGIQGLQGLQGLQGTQGLQGLDGEFAGQGIQGTVGFQGTQGIQGIQGTQGIQGPVADLLITDDTTSTGSKFVTFVNVGSGATDELFVSSTKLFFNPSTGTLNATEFNSLSDLTVKEDIIPIEDVAELLSKINTYEFKWKETGVKSYGVLAQELQMIMPELVNEANGKKYVNYMPLIAVLLEGYKDIMRRLESDNK